MTSNEKKILGKIKEAAKIFQMMHEGGIFDGAYGMQREFLEFIHQYEPNWKCHYTQKEWEKYFPF